VTNFPSHADENPRGGACSTTYGDVMAATPAVEAVIRALSTIAREHPDADVEDVVRGGLLLRVDGRLVAVTRTGIAFPVPSTQRKGGGDDPAQPRAG
jgi:hypothetical protein